ncbi:glycosyltransferase family 2 protein [Capnocytophaga canis]|uniref:glycosyltransferase family 2 protein n=1 Tax=Capnocytophaga canis TaxID=1848903 RepID=UPI00370D3FD2
MTYKEIQNIHSILIKESDFDRDAKITIALPTYNRTALLKESIESCLNQKTMVPFEILVVDNNPERNCQTELLIESFKKVKNLSYYKNSVNIGMVGNWNKVIELSRTNFVVMHTDDDLLDENYIDCMFKILSFFEEDIDVIYPSPKIFSNPSEIHTEKIKKKIKGFELRPFDLQFGNCCSFTGAFLNRNTVIELNGFDINYFPSQDYEMNYRLSQRGKAINTSGYPLVFYRVAENESINPESVLKMISCDGKIMGRIIANYPWIYKKFFNRFYKVYIEKYILWNKKTYGTKSPLIDEYLKHQLEKNIFLDKIVYLFFVYILRKLSKIRRKKIIITDF